MSDKWTLEKAIEDYNTLNPECKSCEFSKYECYEILPYVHEDILRCKVKNKKVKSNDAENCKYYTIK